MRDPRPRPEFVAQITDEYNHLRKEYNTSHTPLLSLMDARQRKHKIDWNNYFTPAPHSTEIEVIHEIPCTELLPLINWRMFFHFWQLTGDFIDDFPYNRCEHCKAQWLVRHSSNPKALEALKLYTDAIDMLDSLQTDKSLSVKAVTGIFPASGRDDDTIEIKGIPFPMLRRQQPNDRGECLCASDFVRSMRDDKDEFVGAFVISVNDDAIINKYSSANEKYSEMLLRSLLDRLAEAGSEYLHRYVRRDLWGYAFEENLTPEQLLAGEYQGIRPAMGYPMTPDQLLNLNIAKLLPFDEIGVTVTENGAMSPVSSISGLYLAHPDARYFMIGKIDDDQLRDYSLRRNIAEEKMRKVLNKNI